MPPASHTAPPYSSWRLACLQQLQATEPWIGSGRSWVAGAAAAAPLDEAVGVLLGVAVDGGQRGRRRGGAARRQLGVVPGGRQTDQDHRHVVAAEPAHLAVGRQTASHQVLADVLRLHALADPGPDELQHLLPDTSANSGEVCAAPL